MASCLCIRYAPINKLQQTHMLYSIGLAGTLCFIISARSQEISICLHLLPKSYIMELVPGQLLTEPKVSCWGEAAWSMHGPLQMLCKLIHLWVDICEGNVCIAAFPFIIMDVVPSCWTKICMISVINDKSCNQNQFFSSLKRVTMRGSHNSQLPLYVVK